MNRRPEKSVSTVQATPNSLTITMDKRTGGLLGLAYPGVGAMLKADAAQSSRVDMACYVTNQSKAAARGAKPQEGSL